MVAHSLYSYIVTKNFFGSCGCCNFCCQYSEWLARYPVRNSGIDVRYFPSSKMKEGPLRWLCKAKYGTIPLTGQVVAPVAPRLRRSTPLGLRLFYNNSYHLSYCLKFCFSMLEIFNLPLLNLFSTKIPVGALGKGASYLHLAYHLSQ